MTAPAPSALTTDDELGAWNAISRGWDAAYDDGMSREQFAAGLRQQLAIQDQGEGFYKAAMMVIGMLEEEDE